MIAWCRYTDKICGDAPIVAVKAEDIYLGNEVVCVVVRYAYCIMYYKDSKAATREPRRSPDQFRFVVSDASFPTHYDPSYYVVPRNSMQYQKKI